MKAVALILALLAPTAGATEIYRWTDENGQTHMSNIEPKHVQEKTITTYQESKVPAATYYPQRAAQPAPRSVPKTGSAHYLPAKQPGASLAECSRAKRNAVLASKGGRKKADERLESWLWKNCRTYSNELRKISQELM